MSRFIHVLYVNDEAGWYAQCLEFDIGAQGDSREDAETAFFHTWHLQIGMDRAHGRKPFEGLEKAPEQFWQMFEEAKTMHGRQPPPEADPDVPPAFMIAAHLERSSRVRPS